MKMKRFVVGLIAFSLLLNSLSSFALAQTAYNLGPGVNAPNTWTALQTFSSGIVSLSVIGGTGTTSTLTLQSTSGVGAAGADIVFKVGNNGATEAMRILNSGNVGIGTTNPGKTLDVSVNTNGELASRVYNPNAGGSAYAQFIVQNDAAQGIGGFQAIGSGTNFGGMSIANSVSVYASIGVMNGISVFSQATGAPLRFGTQSTERMRIDASGNAGIGTTAPASLLDLRAGDLTFSGANGQKYVQGRLTELTSIGSGVTTATTTIQIPADAIVYAVPVRVITQPGGTTTMTVTATTSATAFQKGANISTAAGTTDPGTKNTPVNYNSVAAQTITFTFNVATTNAAGQIRVDVYYATSTPPTS